MASLAKALAARQQQKALSAVVPTAAQASYLEPLTTPRSILRKLGANDSPELSQRALAQDSAESVKRRVRFSSEGTLEASKAEDGAEEPDGTGARPASGVQLPGAASPPPPPTASSGSPDPPAEGSPQVGEGNEGGDAMEDDPPSYGKLFGPDMPAKLKAQFDASPTDSRVKRRERPGSSSSSSSGSSGSGRKERGGGGQGGGGGGAGGNLPGKPWAGKLDSSPPSHSWLPVSPRVASPPTSASASTFSSSSSSTALLSNGGSRRALALLAMAKGGGGAGPGLPHLNTGLTSPPQTIRSKAPSSLLHHPTPPIRNGGEAPVVRMLVMGTEPVVRLDEEPRHEMGHVQAVADESGGASTEVRRACAGPAGVPSDVRSDERDGTPTGLQPLAPVCSPPLTLPPAEDLGAGSTHTRGSPPNELDAALQHSTSAAESEGEDVPDWLLSPLTRILRMKVRAETAAAAAAAAVVGSRSPSDTSLRTHALEDMRDEGEEEEEDVDESVVVDVVGVDTQSLGASQVGEAFPHLHALHSFTHLSPTTAAALLAQAVRASIQECSDEEEEGEGELSGGSGGHPPPCSPAVTHPLVVMLEQEIELGDGMLHGGAWMGEEEEEEEDAREEEEEEEEAEGNDVTPPSFATLVMDDVALERRRLEAKVSVLAMLLSPSSSQASVGRDEARVNLHLQVSGAGHSHPLHAIVGYGSPAHWSARSSSSSSSSSSADSHRGSAEEGGTRRRQSVLCSLTSPGPPVAKALRAWEDEDEGMGRGGEEAEVEREQKEHAGGEEGGAIRATAAHGDADMDVEGAVEGATRVRRLGVRAPPPPVDTRRHEAGRGKPTAAGKRKAARVVPPAQTSVHGRKRRRQEGVSGGVQEWGGEVAEADAGGPVGLAPPPHSPTGLLGLSSAAAVKVQYCSARDEGCSPYAQGGDGAPLSSLAGLRPTRDRKPPSVYAHLGEYPAAASKQKTTAELIRERDKKLGGGGDKRASAH